MTATRFRLEAVLRIRRVYEESARQQLFADNQRARAADAERERRAARYRSVPRSDAPVSPLAFRRERAVAELAAEALHAAETELASAIAQMALSRARWSDAAMRVEALERLERRHAEELHLDELRHELATVDDLVTARWVSPLQPLGTPMTAALEGGQR